MVDDLIVCQPSHVEIRRNGSEITVLLDRVRRSGRIDVNLTALTMFRPSCYCLSGNRSPKSSHTYATLRIPG